MIEQAPTTQNPQYTKLLELLPISDGVETATTDHGPQSVAVAVLGLVKRARNIPPDRLDGPDGQLRPYGGQSGYNLGLTKTVDVDGTPTKVFYEAQVGGTTDETLAGDFDVMLDVNDGSGSVGTIDGLSGRDLTGTFDDSVTTMEPPEVQVVTDRVLGLLNQAVTARGQ